MDAHVDIQSNTCWLCRGIGFADAFDLYSGLFVIVFIFPKVLNHHLAI